MNGFALNFSGLTSLNSKVINIHICKIDFRSKLEYLADSEEQTCKTSPGQAGCENEYWGVK